MEKSQKAKLLLKIGYQLGWPPFTRILANVGIRESPTKHVKVTITGKRSAGGMDSPVHVLFVHHKMHLILHQRTQMGGLHLCHLAFAELQVVK